MYHGSPSGCWSSWAGNSVVRAPSERDKSSGRVRCAEPFPRSLDVDRPAAGGGPCSAARGRRTRRGAGRRESRGAVGGGFRQRGPSGQHPPAHLRRRERRGLLLVRRPADHLPVDPRRGALRPDLHDESGRLRPADGEHERRAHHVRLLLSGRRVDHLRVDAPGRRRMPAPAELPDGLRVGHLRQLRHLPREPGRQRPDPVEPTSPATTPRRRSGRTAAWSSPACATATWRSTP